ncbi:MAG: ester cyclase [Nitrosarchaeum sp.]|nr:ester cyclase [Nitrosarchaeum sp.]
MANQSTVIGIAVVTFLVGLGAGYTIFQSSFQPEMTTSMQTELENYKAAERLAMQHLETFDELDFVMFTNQDWDGFKESHSEDIIVYWPDGSKTVGLPRHIEDLDAMFGYAPDTRIHEHPIKIASGEWTAVVGIMEGTFTEPMSLPDGSVIEPTGKAFKLTMCTVGHWKNGVMIEEYLFWDNQTFMQQIGLA